MALVDQNRRNGESSRTLVVLIAVGALGLILLCGAIGAVVVGLPAWQQAREAARRQAATKNLRDLGRALEQYHDTQASGSGLDTNADPAPVGVPVSDETE